MLRLELLVWRFLRRNRPRAQGTLGVDHSCAHSCGGGVVRTDRVHPTGMEVARAGALLRT